MTEAVNAFLFRGEIRAYWRLLARGADGRHVVERRHGARTFDFGLDGKGMARRNGGIVSPSDRVVGSGRYLYRFVGTAAYAAKARAAVLGHWWIDEDTWRLLRDASRSHKLSLEATAQLYLALPDEWGDRGRVARGKLFAPLMAWTGNGQVAAASSGEPFTPAQHNKAVQLFVPGEPSVIGRAFADGVECIYTRDVPTDW